MEGERLSLPRAWIREGYFAVARQQPPLEEGFLSNPDSVQKRDPFYNSLGFTQPALTTRP